MVNKVALYYACSIENMYDISILRHSITTLEKKYPDHQATYINI